MMKKFFLMAVAAVALLASCSKDDPIVKEENGINAGKKVVVLSDIHMGDQRGRDGGWGWFNERKPELLSFLNDIASKPQEYGTVVVAGDMFDEWVAPMTVCPFQNLNGEDSRKESDHFQVMVRDNKDVLDAFRRIRAAGIELVYVPGNHDLTCTKEDFDNYLPGLFTQARDAFGVGSYTPQGMEEVIIEHGHRYDYNDMPNAISTPGGHFPIGYVCSKYGSTVSTGILGEDMGNDDALSLYNRLEGLLYDPQAKAEFEQFLAEKGVTDWLTYEEFCDAVQQMKSDADRLTEYAKTGEVPNGIVENFNHFASNAAWAVVMIAKPPHSVWQLLEILFTDVQFPEPYNESYMFWDILPYFHHPALFRNLWTNENWAALQNNNNVNVELPFVMSILAGGVDPVLDAMAPYEYFNDPDCNKRIVVFGHTHKGMIRQHENTEYEKCIYANTGCWIDDKWGNPANGVTFKTYVELEKKDGIYTVTLKEWGKQQVLAQDVLKL